MMCFYKVSFKLQKKKVKRYMADTAAYGGAGVVSVLLFSVISARDCNKIKIITSILLRVIDSKNINLQYKPK